jgi:hypothetical protein
MKEPAVLIGIEHEFAFARDSGRFIDYANSDFATLAAVVAALPVHEADAAVFRTKSVEKQPKRWYVEGLELHSKEGSVVSTLPKGIELRTTPHANIPELVEEFEESFRLMTAAAGGQGLSPVLTSFNPLRDGNDIDLFFPRAERTYRTPEEMNIACRAMAAYGFHINISVRKEALAPNHDLARKLRFYLPALVPLSLSSPLQGGRLFKGLSYRIYTRSFYRQLVGLRTDGERAYVEFKGFDVCGDGTTLHALCSVLKGLALDHRLTGRTDVQDGEALRDSAIHGTRSKAARQTTQAVLDAAAEALTDDRDRSSIELLRENLRSHRSLARTICERYVECGDPLAAIAGLYAFGTDASGKPRARGANTSLTPVRAGRGGR